jgi:hypothetical protein
VIDGPLTGTFAFNRVKTGASNENETSRVPTTAPTVTTAAFFTEFVAGAVHLI